MDEFGHEAITFISAEKDSAAASLPASHFCAPFSLALVPLSPPEPLADFQRQSGLIHRIEMQAGRTAGEQALAQPGDEVEAEGANRFGVVAEAFEGAPHPARQFGAAGVGKACQFEEAADRHDARDDGDVFRG